MSIQFIQSRVSDGWEHYYRESIKLTPEQREDEDFMKQFKEDYDNYDRQHLTTGVGAPLGQESVPRDR